MTARLGDDEYQGYGSINEAAGGWFNPRGSEGGFGELHSGLSKAIFDIERQTNTLREYHQQINRGQGDIATLAEQMENNYVDLLSICIDAAKNMFNLVLSAKNSGEREKQLFANILRADFERAFSNFKSVQTDVMYLLKNLPSQPPPDFGAAPTYGDTGEVFIEDDDEHARLLRREQQERRNRRELPQRRQQQLLLEDDTTMMQQRAEEMGHLAEDFLVLNDWMRDIMQVVVEQGEQIDTIEQHIEYTQPKTVVGHKKLQQAKAQQQSNRRLCCCIICIICIIVIVLVVLGAIAGIVTEAVKK